MLQFMLCLLITLDINVITVSFCKLKVSSGHTELVLLNAVQWPWCSPGGGTSGISGWGCAAGTLEPLTYTRASSAEFCYPILE